jgi:hypothetical protein
MTQGEVALYRHWLLLRRWLINLLRFLAFASALPPDSVSVLTLLIALSGQAEFASDERHFLSSAVSIHMDIQMIPLPIMKKL